MRERDLLSHVIATYLAKSYASKTRNIVSFSFSRVIDSDPPICCAARAYMSLCRWWVAGWLWWSVFDQHSSVPVSCCFNSNCLLRSSVVVVGVFGARRLSTHSAAIIAPAYSSYSTCDADKNSISILSNFRNVHGQALSDMAVCVIESRTFELRVRDAAVR